MATHNEIVEVESNVVKITTGGIEKEYNKTDLKCTSTDISVAVLYYTDGKDTIVAQWNDSQADEYGYTLSSLKIMIDTVLSLEVDSYTSSEVDTLLGGKANKATQRSGSVIAFDTDANYGTIASPLTGNITGDYTDAIIGVVQMLIHNDSVAPTIPATWIKANTSASYTTGVVNFIAITWLSSNIATCTIWKSA